MSIEQPAPEANLNTGNMSFNHPHFNIIQEFRDAITAAGLTPPDLIEGDGKIRRFSSNGKHGDEAGWYLLHSDGIPAGCFGDWRTGLKVDWRANIGRPLSARMESRRIKAQG